MPRAAPAAAKAKAPVAAKKVTKTVKKAPAKKAPAKKAAATKKVAPKKTASPAKAKEPELDMMAIEDVDSDDSDLLDMIMLDSADLPEALRDLIDEVAEVYHDDPSLHAVAKEAAQEAVLRLLEDADILAEHAGREVVADEDIAAALQTSSRRAVVQSSPKKAAPKKKAAAKKAAPKKAAAKKTAKK